MPKFDSQTPARISALDFNYIRDKIVSILGDTDGGQKGYGQTIHSSPVNSGQLIEKDQWDRLRIDILNTKLHQDGIFPPVVTLGEDSETELLIGYSEQFPNTNYNTIADNAILAKFNIGVGQSVVSTPVITNQTSLGTLSKTGSWSTQSQCTLVVRFPGGYVVDNNNGDPPILATGADNARHFFNSGGKIRFTSSRTGGTSSPQNNAWTNLLNTAEGNVSFGADFPVNANFYTLTTVPQSFYTLSASTPYSANNYTISASINTDGDTVTFIITWNDSYVDPGPTPPGDLTDGTLSISVEEFKAAGSMLPSGNFTITSPSYEFGISGITQT
jgi:hypothetical protein